MPAWPFGGADRGRGENARQQRAENAADAMDAENVERVVVASFALSQVEAQ